MVHMPVLRGICGSELGIKPSKVTTRQIAGKMLSEIKDTGSALASSAVKNAKLASVVLGIPIAIGYLKEVVEGHYYIVEKCNIKSPMEVFTKGDCYKAELIAYHKTSSFVPLVASTLNIVFPFLITTILEDLTMSAIAPVVIKEKKRFSWCKDINDSKLESCAISVLKSLAIALVPVQWRPFMIGNALYSFKDIVPFNNK